MPQLIELTEADPDVVRFAAALRAAAHDKQIEALRPIRFYYDADVLLRIINGFQQFRRDLHPIRDPRNVMVRSLLALGLAGPLYVLRPHALEIEEDLRWRRATAEGFNRELIEFLRTVGVAGLFVSLHQAIVSAWNDTDKINQFVRIVTHREASAFPFIELADGGWQQRLARFQRRGLIAFEDGLGSIKEVLRDPVVWQMRSVIARERAGNSPLDSMGKNIRGGQPVSPSVLHDATALGMLRREVTRFEAGESVTEVRFYSESNMFQRVWKHAPTRDLLTYQRQGTEKKDVDFIVRDQDYFILRMIFGSLCFSGQQPVQPRSAETPPADLMRLSDELAALIAGEQSDLKRFLESRLVAEKPLGTYLEEFKTLSFLPTFLRQWSPTDRLKDVVSGLSEVWEFATRSEVRERFAREAGEVLAKLRDTVAELGVAFNDLRSILDAANAFWREQTENYRPPDPTRDLGLIRWGIELGGESLERFRLLIERIVAPDDETRWLGCVDLTDTLTTAGEDYESYAIACSVLWALNMFDVIVGSLEKAPQANQPGLRLLCLAAKLKAKRNLGLDEKSALLAEGADAVESAPEEDRARFAIGLGYLYFHAWLLERNASHAGVASNSSQAWLERSLELGSEAVQALPRGTLPWAFALNHCVYVGDYADSPPPGLAGSRKTLARLWHDHRELWNYRFADTIGFHNLVTAENQYGVVEGSRMNVPEHLLQSLMYHLNEAERHYARIEGDYGDAEIAEHRERLRTLKARFAILPVVQEERRKTQGAFPPGNEPII